MSDTDHDANGHCHGGGMDQGNGQEAPPGISRSIRPGVPVPETVLVVVISGGSYLLVGYPQGEPTAWIIAKDAGLLHQALDDAFGRGQPTGSEIDGAALPSHKVTHVKECPIMTREDRELLAELARLNGDMAPLGLRIIEGQLPRAATSPSAVKTCCPQALPNLETAAVRHASRSRLRDRKCHER